MWTKEMFHVSKPIIALLHIRALPGDPYFDSRGGLEKVIDTAGTELHALQAGGVDGILFANEFSLPYQKHADSVTIASMSYVIGCLKREISLPFGVSVVANPMATIELAAATRAQFVRNTFTGAYIGENGFVDTNVGDVVRRKYALGLSDLKMLYKVNPESDVFLAERDLKVVTRSIIFHCFPDALCVSGYSAGRETNSEILSLVKEASRDVPVFCNTGCTAENILEKLAIADGACVGTTFKKDGIFDNVVEISRVKKFMDNVAAFRAKT